ncbi:MAG: T9SS type A sorting domain-containing protein [Bacteroidota bacterium]
MKKIVLPVIAIVCLFLKINAQCFDPFPPSNKCIDAPIICPFNYYCGTLDPTLTNEFPTTFCGSVQNGQWLGFIASTTDMAFNVMVSNCAGTLNGVGLQAQIFGGCDPDWPMASNCVFQILPGAQEVLVANDLIPGNTYYILLDGFAGDVCDYDIEVIQGATFGPGSIVTDAGSNQFLNCNNTFAILDGSNSTYPANATFVWKDQFNNILSNDLVFTTTQPGQYILTIIAPEECPTSDTVVVINQGVITLDLEESTFLHCDGPTVLDEGFVPQSPNYTYSWTTLDGNILGGESTPLPIIDATGTYQLTIFDNVLNCTHTDAIEVLDFEMLFDFDNDVAVECTSSGAFFLDAIHFSNIDNNTLTYSWTTTNGNILAGANEKEPEINSEGIYEVFITESTTGCTVSSAVNVSEGFEAPVPQIDFVGNSFITCAQSSVELTAANSTTPTPVLYRWRNSAGFLISTTPTATVDEADTYTLELVKQSTNCSFTTSIAVSEYLDLPFFHFPSPVVELNCNNNFTAELEPVLYFPAGPNIYYTWTSPSGFFSTDPSIIVSGNIAETYVLTITNIDNGCEFSEMVEVINNGFEMIVNTSNATCDLADGGASVTTNVANPAFAWSTGATTQSISDLSQGWYSVTVTDVDQGCGKHQNFYIDEELSCKVVISGYVLNDPDSTCVFDPNLLGMEQVMVKIEPLGHYTFTDADGYYEFVVDDGNYTVEFIGASFVDLQCPLPGSYSVMLNTNGSASTDNHFFVKWKDFDLSIVRSVGFARPGFDQYNSVMVCNWSDYPQNAVVDAQHDTIFSQVQPQPNMQPLNNLAADYTYNPSNNTFTWEVSNLAPGECRKITWLMKVPDDALLGSFINGTAKVYPTNDDNPTNNYTSWEILVTNSYDPNDKRNFVGADQFGGDIHTEDITMDYNIRFQNTGTDTAYTVVIRDTLDDAHLDVTTLRGFVASHAMSVEFEESNILVFRFENINLPDSLTNPTESAGWVGFSIDRKPDQAFGTQIKNQVAIYFDFNVPIITNEVVNTLVPHYYEIAGEIRTEYGDEVENVNVLLSGDANETMTTEIWGSFLFENLIQNSAHELSFEKNINPLNGVTTQDIVKIRRHILGIEYLDSPYKIIAADANASGEITALDMVLIRSLILLNISEFPDNTSWRFVDADYVFTDPTNPWNFPETYSIADLNAGRFYNILGIKIGDVNETANAANLSHGDTRNLFGEVLLSIDNQLVEQGKEYLMAIKATDFQSITALQFTLDFEEKSLSFVGFEKGALEAFSSQNIGLNFLKEGKITVAWTAPHGKSIEAETPLFFLKFKATRDGKLSDLLQINSDKTAALAYDESDNEMYVNVLFEALQPKTNLQVFPNPTSDDLWVNFELTQAQKVHLEIYNALGQLEKIILQHQIRSEGFFNEKISLRALPQGAYFLHLELGDEVVVRKFVKL